MPPVDVVFLTEAGASSGMGHVRRTMILAHALSNQSANCVFGINSTEGRNLVTNFPVYYVADAVLNGGDILIVDSYHFSPEQVTRWSKKFTITVLIDDLGERPVPCDVVINHNIYGNSVDYSGYSAHYVLAGVKYAMIDPKFFNLRCENLEKQDRVLVCFGGGDTARYGLDAAKLLSRLTDVPIDVAMGSSKATMICDNVFIHQKADMVALMQKASFYFGALGVSFIEALAAGLPAVGVATANNQVLATKAAKGFGIPVFEISELDDAANKAAEFITSSRSFNTPLHIDGQGAHRLANEVLCIFTKRLSEQTSIDLNAN